jgi:hypothetical protein
MLHRRRRNHARLAMGLLAGGLLVAWAIATPGLAQTDAGPVTWEVVDVTQAVRSDGHGIRWQYLLVLRETKGRTIQFETREYEVLGATKAPPRMAPYRERLLPKSELRIPLVTVLQLPTGWPAARRVTAVWRFGAKDDAGKPVSFEARVPLDRNTGRRLFPPSVTPGPSSLPRVPVTAVEAVAGEWQGHYRTVDGYDLPLRLVIKEGAFEVGEGDPIRRRFRGRVGVRDGLIVWSTSNAEGTLALHKDAGRRILDGRLVIAAEGRPSLNYDVRVVEATPGLEMARTPAPAGAAQGLAIAIRYPPDQGRLTEQTASVVADVSSERGLATIGVTVNGVRVYEQGGSGATAMPLNVPITLREGSNVIVVSATETGGGVRQEVRTVTYQLPAGIRVSYRVHGSAMNMNLKYRRPDGRTEEKRVTLPLDAVWELLFSAREGDLLEVTAQNAGEAGWVTCEIVVEGTSITARTEEGRAPAVTCKGIVTSQR